MSSPAANSPHAGCRLPAEVISHAIWLYFRFPLGLRMVVEMLAARGIIVSHETVRQWALKFGQAFANRIRRRLPRAGGKCHLAEVAIGIAGVKHWLWRAVDQTGMALGVLVQKRRDKRAAKRLLRKLLKRQCRAPRVMVTDRLPSYGAAGAALPLRPQPGRQPFPPPPRPHHRRAIPRRERACVRGLGRKQRGCRRLNRVPPSSSAHQRRWPRAVNSTVPRCDLVL